MQIKGKTESGGIFYLALCLDLWEETGVQGDLGKWGQTLPMSTWYSYLGAGPELVLPKSPCGMEKIWMFLHAP